MPEEGTQFESGLDSNRGLKQCSIFLVLDFVGWVSEVDMVTYSSTLDLAGHSLTFLCGTEVYMLLLPAGALRTLCGSRSGLWNVEKAEPG